MKRWATLLLLVLAACGRYNGPRANRLHAPPFEFLASVRLGMRERDLMHERALQRVAPGEYFEMVASYGVVYVTAQKRLVGMVVPERYASETAGLIAFTQHQQEAFRSLGISRVCAFDAQENRRLVLFQMADGVHEIALRMSDPSGAFELTRSLLLTPSVQWRRARQQPCNR